jgi:hypothetical protein
MNIVAHVRFIFPSLVLWIGCAGVINAQVESPVLNQDSAQKQQQPPSTESLAEQKASAERELKEAEAALEAASSDEKQPPETLVAEVEFLTTLDLLLGQVQSVDVRSAELRASKSKWETDLQHLRTRGPEEERPFRFIMLESLRDQLAAESNRSESVIVGTESAADAAQAARKLLEEKERARRKAKEELEINNDEAKKSQLAQSFRMAELDSRIASARLRLREQESENQQLEQDVHDLRMSFLKEKNGLSKTRRYGNAALKRSTTSWRRKDSASGKSRLANTSLRLSANSACTITSFQSYASKASRLTEKSRQRKETQTSSGGSKSNAVNSRRSWASTRKASLNGRLLDDSAKNYWQRSERKSRR